MENRDKKALIWVTEAGVDLIRIHNFLEANAPLLTERVEKLIEETAEQLLTHPYLGKSMSDETGRRELKVRFGRGGYVIRYRLDLESEPKHIAILRIWHTREHREND